MKKERNWLLIILIVVVAIWILPSALGALGSLVWVGFSFLGAALTFGFWAFVAWILWKIWKKT